jgi:hypothetical protein
MTKMEARLERTGRLEEFNPQFQDNIDRGVFSRLAVEEAQAYEGPIN